MRAFILALLLSTSAHAQVVVLSSPTQSRPIVAISGLPTCNAAARGRMYLVTDALAPVALATVASGGAVVIGVACNGTNWIVQ